MKMNLWCLALLTGFTSPLVLANPNLPGILAYFPEPAQMKIFVVPKPLLDLRLVSLQADDDDWEELDVNLSWDTNSQIADGLAQLKKSYPGYDVNYPVLSSGSKIHLEIPSIQVRSDLQPSPGANGPWLQYPLVISKKESAVLEAHFSSDSNVAVLSGSVVASFPMDKVIEHVALPRAYCQKLLVGPSSLYEVIKAFPGVLRTVDDLEALPTTKESLKRSVLESCMILPKEVSVSSFGDLLNLKVSPSAGTDDPFGETRGLVMSDTNVSLDYDLKQEKL